MTDKEAAAQLRYIGLTLRKRDGEYRVAFRDTDDEASAYYTNDRDDAVATGREMASSRWWRTQQGRA